MHAGDNKYKLHITTFPVLLSLVVLIAWQCSPVPVANEKAFQIQTEMLIKQVENGPPSQRIRAAAKLASLGPEALPVIRSKLPTATTAGAPVLLALVVRWNDISAVPLVTPLLDSAERSTSLAAVECLGRLGEVRMLEKIIFDDNSLMEMRLTAVRSLALIPKRRTEKSTTEASNSDAAEDVLIRLLASPRAIMVGEAIGSLRYLRSDRALPFLAPLTDFHDPFVAISAEKALRAIKSRQGQKTAAKTFVERKTPPAVPVVSLPPPDTEKNLPAAPQSVHMLDSLSSVWKEDMDYLRRSAKPAGLDLTVLHLPGRLLDAPDGFRLAWVEEMLQHPLEAVPNFVSFVQNLSFQDEQEAARHLAKAFKAAHHILGASCEGPSTVLRNKGSNGVPLSEAIRAQFVEQKGIPDERQAARLKELDRILPPEMSLALGNLYAAMANLHQAWEKCLAGVRPDDLRLLRSAAYSLFDPLAARDRTDISRIGPLVFNLDLAPVREAEQCFLESLAAAIAIIEVQGTPHSSAMTSLPWSLDTPIGKVILYGPGSDVIDETGCLVIDFGGNDLIRCPAGAAGAGGIRVSVYLDASGNDTYQWDKGPAFGAGFLGTGVLADLQGNDVYRAAHMAMGAGMIGSGLFYDAQGDDAFLARSFSQGAAAFGVGILADGGGTDRYHCGFASQGFGGPGGVGVLLEETGDDSYESGGVAPDTERDASHFLSMSQGVGLGLRFIDEDFRQHSLSGGVGVLADLGGDDSYRVDLFGQGAGYYFGAGLLFDGKGNDRFEGYNYTQGAGVHSAAGALLNGAGNDVYKGAHHSAGLGLDRGAGVLFDMEGNDRYENQTDCQGAGLKPYGLGILVDHGGEDDYRCRAGRGFSRIPEYWPSQWPTGLFLDRFGRDTYEGEGLEQNHKLLLRLKRGLGVDGQ